MSGRAGAEQASRARLCAAGSFDAFLLYGPALAILALAVADAVSSLGMAGDAVLLATGLAAMASAFTVVVVQSFLLGRGGRTLGMALTGVELRGGSRARRLFAPALAAAMPLAGAYALYAGARLTAESLLDTSSAGTPLAAAAYAVRGTLDRADNHPVWFCLGALATVASIEAISLGWTGTLLTGVFSGARATVPAASATSTDSASSWSLLDFILVLNAAFPSAVGALFFLSHPEAITPLAISGCLSAGGIAAAELWTRSVFGATLGKRALGAEG